MNSQHSEGVQQNGVFYVRLYAFELVCRAYRPAKGDVCRGTRCSGRS